MAAWRWYFRFISLLAIPFATIAYIYIPATAPASSNQIDLTTKDKWRRFDIAGCALMLAATLLFILSLTLGAQYGFKTASFLVPFLLCWPIGATFGFWENRL